MSNIAQYGLYYILLNVFTDSKGSTLFILYLLLLRLVLCLSEAIKCFPVYLIHSADYTIYFDPLRSARIFRVLKLFARAIF